jgi:hypothetical protein
MRKIALLAATAALALSGAALADGSTGPNPAQSCKQQRTAMGASAFKDLYGTNAHKTNAFGKCVAKQAGAQQKAEAAAAKAAPTKCRAERNADPAAFAQKYGTTKKKTNAFGKCVSATAKADGDQAIADHDQAIVTAAKTCKAERATDPAAFAKKYGTNHNRRNAFGKCVSQHARAGQGD